MSGPVVLAILITWLAIGLVLALALGHRGHDRFTWLVLGTIMGPAGVALGLLSWRNERLGARTLAAGARGPGAVDILVGFDGSAGSRAAVTAAAELLGDRLGRLTLLTVVPFDAGTVAEKDALGLLESEGARLARLAPRLEVGHGHPAHVLAEAAEAGGYRLLVIGARRSGRAHAFGSVEHALTQVSTVPVLLVRGASAEPATARRALHAATG